MEHAEDEPVSFFKGPTVGLCTLECLKAMAYGDKPEWNNAFERVDTIYEKRLMENKGIEDPDL